MLSSQPRHSLWRAAAGRRLPTRPRASARSKAQASRHTTPSCRAGSAATLWFSPSRLVAAGARNPRPSCGSLHKRALRARTLPSARPSSLLELPLETVASAAGAPAVHEVLQDARWLDAPASSRLPARTYVAHAPGTVVCTGTAPISVAKSARKKKKGRGRLPVAGSKSDGLQVDTACHGGHQHDVVLSCFAKGFCL